MDTFWCWFFIVLCGAAIGGGIWFDRWLSRSDTPLEPHCNFRNCLVGRGVATNCTCVLGGDPWAEDCPKFEPKVEA